MTQHCVSDSQTPLTTFQMTMSQIFSPLVDKCVIVNLDDILIYSETRAHHLKDLEAVFTLLREHRLLTKGYECNFLEYRLEFLGHVISTKGVEVDPRKIETVQTWLPSSNLLQLQSFLGFVNYVQRPNMVGVTALLTELMRKGTKYKKGEKEQSAFSELSPYPSHCQSPPFIRKQTGKKGIGTGRGIT
ncbi:hypothetical protein CLOM_g9265 [Closterium sp. NIES-68]|nr:hypothetical protein CLOM_g9265 [Closterium sp. NIES-68]GJP58823.1 hypothetical protein CLOP_g3933 [Closterium sp. NIES-67]